MGIVDVQIVRAEGMNMPPLAANAVPKANKAIEEFVL
jgi:FMN-dependent NADH-azoreductase